MKPRWAAGMFALAAGAMLQPGSAHAQASSDLQIRATVEDNCTVLTSPLDFGDVFWINFGNRDATATISLSCTANLDYVVTIDNGQHFNGRRRMFSPAVNRYVAYQVYTDPVRTQVWGSDVAQGQPGNSGASGQKTLTAYARIPGFSLIYPTGYTDTLTVTVHF